MVDYKQALNALKETMAKYSSWGSTDGSTARQFLKKMKVSTLLTLKSPGYLGTQLRMGFSYALKQKYEGIIQIDGNNKDGVAINTPPIRYLAVRFLASPILSLGAILISFSHNLKQR